LSNLICLGYALEKNQVLICTDIFAYILEYIEIDGYMEARLNKSNNAVRVLGPARNCMNNLPHLNLLVL